LRGYVRRLRGGGLRKNGQPRVVAEGPAWALVDGDSALGMVSSVFAMNTAMAKAATAGIAFVGLRNNCHFGAAGCYAAMALEKNMIGIAVMVEVLSAILTGAAIRWQVLSWSFSDPSKPTGHGAAFIAINISAFMPVDQFRERMDQTILEIRASEKADGADRVYLPGEM